MDSLCSFSLSLELNNVAGNRGMVKLFFRYRSDLRAEVPIWGCLIALGSGGLRSAGAFSKPAMVQRRRSGNRYNLPGLGLRDLRDVENLP